MRNIAFVIWMIGYPFLSSVATSYRMKVTGHKFSQETLAVASLIHLALWITVGAILLERGCA